ncbi:DUF4876 domain-containing protein [Niabella hibiscisoli]|uniref:DUF4876 domain-containing protein n=1 Tax=Niabella hibiscisoli TaxID=1825928 RepID=UPI001F0D449C|nr:DUF4876 domain-containing protein [Niabella hibiscisoli]MCH5715180.1 DUF4876 domain-containing protein [Niabella hibiscisoli]
MKKQFLIFVLLLTFLFSCRKSDIQTVQAISLSVQVAYSSADSALGLPKNNMPVKITNLINGQENTANTNADGVAVFASIVPGNYTIAVSKNYTAEEFFTLTNVSVGSNVAYNATETQALNTNASVKLQLQSGKIGDLVFKQIYYAGSNTKSGAIFRDQFVEIYNNSNQTIYLDSLYVGSTQARNTALSAGGVPLDWTTVIGGMPSGTGDANKDYLYFRHLFMIPGTGKDHPLAPGKSIIIAQTALDHTKPYIDNDGKQVGNEGILDPAVTINLSNADFETNVVEYKRANYSGTTTFKPFGTDVDNPLVPNLAVLNCLGSNDWVMDATGKDDFIMFKAPGVNIALRPIYTLPLAGTNPSLQVPITVSILDAVEIITPLETGRTLNGCR